MLGVQVKARATAVRAAAMLGCLAKRDAELLVLDEAKRRRTIIRIDRGGGDDDEVDWVLKAEAHPKKVGPTP